MINRWLLILSLLIPASSGYAATTERVSIASDGTEANNSSYNATVSADGRFIAFESPASNLVLNDTNATWDIFVHDRQTGATERVSVASDGTEANATSNSSDEYGHDYGPDISEDGLFVAFFSNASNLIEGDTNGIGDIFVHDRQTGTTERVSVASDGTEGYEMPRQPSISSDGRFIAFRSPADNLVSGDTNGFEDIFVHDRQLQTTERVSVSSDGIEGNSNSYYPGISADGRYVSFSSQATNLVLGDTSSVRDAFVHDRQTGTTERVSVASDGSEADNWTFSPSISANGLYVVFETIASNLTTDDTNGVRDIYIHDRDTNSITRVSIASDGTEGNGLSFNSRVSTDGRFVTFHSSSSNLVDGDTNNEIDIFLHDRTTGVTERVSVASDGSEADLLSYNANLSSDGRFVVFHSHATDLVVGDTNTKWDIFLHDRQTGLATQGSATPWLYLLLFKGQNEASTPL